MRGGVRDGSGRKTGSKNKVVRIARNVVKQVRWTDEEWFCIIIAADKWGMKPSEFIRKAALRASERGVK